MAKCQRCDCTNYDPTLKGTITDTEGNILQCSICAQPADLIGKYALESVEEARYLLGNLTARPRLQTPEQVERIKTAMEIADSWIRILDCKLTETDDPRINQPTPRGVLDTSNAPPNSIGDYPMAKEWHAITMKKRKQLARRSVTEANGNTRSTAELANARRIIEEIVKDDPARYLEFHAKYCTPKDEVIIAEVVDRLTPQLELF